ncbi:MAG: dihydroorotate dehydrogenase electron transfer subunit [Planctomycetota bacterium]|jgi:dihydroorotate dehydrogenase electron transfer subunit|nr:dihydroorotate dehydrogenase electron transfer subunit [Planctomycetota bacterium]
MKKMDIAARVLENLPAGPGCRLIRLRAPELAGAFRPGQFAQLRLRPDRLTPFLRRPFAPCAYWPDGFSIFYAVSGRGTSLLAETPPGEEIGALGPLGNAYSLPSPGGQALLLGGGAGAPSLGPLLELLRENGTETVLALGARDESRLPREPELAALAGRTLIATDDGGRGFAGNVVDAVRADPENVLARASRLYACGPLPMLRAAAGLAAERSLPCEVSLEARMACGFGACLGCAVPMRTADGGPAYRRACHDGPVFEAGSVDWSRLE